MRAALERPDAAQLPGADHSVQHATAIHESLALAEWKIDYGQRADQMLHVEIGDGTLLEREECIRAALAAQAVDWTCPGRYNRSV